MRVATRLNLAILPAVVGLAVLVGLAYWGDRGRQAPEVFVACAAVATVASTLLSWRATRFVSQRVGALAADFRALGFSPPVADAQDEFEELASVRESARALADDQARLRAATAEAIRDTERRRVQYAAVFEQVALSVALRLEEARLALHILQTSPFGDLNENQEELVSAARSAADNADGDLQRLVRLVTLPVRRRATTRETVSVRALLEPAVAIAAARAREQRVTITLVRVDEVAPVLVDRLATQEALSLLLPVLCVAAPPDSALQIRANDVDGAVQLRIAPGLGPAPAAGLSVLLARALLEEQPGVLETAPEAVVVQLPSPPSSVWRASAQSVHYAPGTIHSETRCPTGPPARNVSTGTSSTATRSAASVPSEPRKSPPAR